MSEPLYSVGQHVAVCSRCLTVVIPATKVVASELRSPGLYDHPITGLTHMRQDWRWAYLVEHSPRGRNGKLIWLSEIALRPINPDEYLDTTHQSTESREGVAQA